MSAARCRFLLESVADLQARLRAQGSDLLIQRGHPEDVIPGLVSKLGGATTVYAHADVCSEEMKVHSAVKAALSRPRSAGGGGSTTAADAAVMVKEVWGNTLHHTVDLPFDFPVSVPEVFTQVRRCSVLCACVAVALQLNDKRFFCQNIWA